MKFKIVFLFMTLINTAVFSACEDSIAGLRTIEKMVDESKYVCTDSEKSLYGSGICQLNYKELKAYYKQLIGESLVYEGIAKIKSQTAKSYQSFKHLKPGQIKEIKESYGEIIKSVNVAKFARDLFESNEGKTFLLQDESIDAYCINIKIDTPLCKSYKNVPINDARSITNELKILRQDGLLDPTNNKKMDEYAGKINFQSKNPDELLAELKQNPFYNSLQGDKITESEFKNFKKNYSSILNDAYNISISDDVDGILNLETTAFNFEYFDNTVKEVTTLSPDDSLEAKKSEVWETYKKKLSSLHNSRSVLFKSGLHSSFENINDDLDADLCDYSMLAGDCINKLKQINNPAKNKYIKQLEAIDSSYNAITSTSDVKSSVDLACFSATETSLSKCEMGFDEAIAARTDAINKAKKAEQLIKKLQNNESIKSLENVKSLIVYNLHEAKCVKETTGIIVSTDCKGSDNLVSSEFLVTLKETGEILTTLHSDLNTNDIKTTETKTLAKCDELAQSNASLSGICLPVDVQDGKSNSNNFSPDTFRHRANPTRSAENEAMAQYRANMTARAVLGTGIGTWMNYQQNEMQNEIFINQAKRDHFYSSPEFMEYQNQLAWQQAFNLPQSGPYDMWGMNNLSNTGYFGYAANNGLIFPPSSNVNNQLVYDPNNYVNPIVSAGEYN